MQPDSDTPTLVAGSTAPSEKTLSYKFQRLRERLRVAIERGDLGTKLPGERALARQFQVNAKTLSKALTDLAAEGLLDRSIGRGTYVKGHAPAAATTGRWLVLADDATPPELLHALQASGESVHTMTEPVDRIRPSFINQFSAVIDLAADTPERFLRDLVVRGLPVVVVGREPGMYSLNAILIDRQLGASRLARQMLLAGHRHLAVATDRAEIGFVETVRSTVVRFDPQATVDAIFPTEVLHILHNGATGVICDSSASAALVCKTLDHAKLVSPPALAAVGMSAGSAPCSGYYVSPQQVVTAVTELLNNTQATRPAILWLTGKLTDRGTIWPVSPGAPIPAATTASPGTGLQA